MKLRTETCRSDRRTSNRPSTSCASRYVDAHATDLALSRAFWVDALGFIVTEETSDALYLRGLEERNHHSVVLRKAPEPDVTAVGFKAFSEEDIDRAARFCADRGLPHRFVERPAQGRRSPSATRTGRRSSSSSKWTPCPSMLRRYGAYRGACVQRIDHVNCYSPDVQASVRLLHRDRLSHHGVRGRRRAGSALVRVAAPQGQRARHRVHQRPRTSFSSRRNVGQFGHRHHSHLRRALDDRLAGEHGARPWTPRALECVLLLPARPGRPSCRAVHERLPARSIRITSRPDGICAIRSGRRYGACRRRGAGSRKGNASRA